MKQRTILIITLLLTMTALGLIPGTASAETTNEDFLRNFEGVYAWEKGLYQGAIDSANPYSKPLRILKTTESGINVLLDRVLVTEDELAVSFLISGDFPQDLIDVQLFADIDVGPLLPYPPDTFAFSPRKGLMGGGGPNLRLVNDNPLAILDVKTVRLMTYDGYVSPSDPIQVKIRVKEIHVGWEGDTDAYGTTWIQYYYDEEPLVFEFETDGAELAAQTQTIPLDHTFEIDGKTYEFHQLRFNPMQLILFTGEMSSDFSWENTEGVRFVIATADNGTEIRLNAVEEADCPYYGFRTKILDPEIIHTLEQTKTLTLTPCYSPGRSTSEDPNTHLLWEEPVYDCSPEHAVTVNIRA